MRTVYNLFLSSLLVLYLGPSSALAASIGVITELEGTVELIREGEALEPAVGVEVQEGDLIRTQASAHAQLEMDDGSILNAGESSELLLSEYQLEPDNSTRSAVVGVLKGWLRFVVATVAPRGRYEISTGMATIGIRGTEGIVHEDAEQTILQLTEGHVDVVEAGESFDSPRAVRMRAGQFYRRARGRRGIRTSTPGPAFRASLPPKFKQRPTRRSAVVPRGQKPKYRRTLSSFEAQDLLRKHPRFKEKLRLNLGRKNRLDKDRSDRGQGSGKSRPKSKSPQSKKPHGEVERPSRPSSRRKEKPRPNRKSSAM